MTTLFLGVAPVRRKRRHLGRRDPNLTTLDNIVARVGVDFPAVGALIRAAWTEGA